MFKLRLGGVSELRWRMYNKWQSVHIINVDTRGPCIAAFVGGALLYSTFTIVLLYFIYLRIFCASDGFLLPCVVSMASII